MGAASLSTNLPGSTLNLNFQPSTSTLRPLSRREAQKGLCASTCAKARDISSMCCCTVCRISGGTLAVDSHIITCMACRSAKVVPQSQIGKLHMEDHWCHGLQVKTHPGAVRQRTPALAQPG